ncbi:MAG: 1-acyl-sn-glycerol-3-phosphate acyltransferase, partial [Emcibacteraceae bacterium]|nr:1-acyl-sn-glycerol-3-phosphate acyltransferase [Emcibacteraceae bacterium]
MITAEGLVLNYFPLLKKKSTLFRIVCGVTRFMIRESDFQKFSRDNPHARGFNFIDLVMDYFDFDVSLAEQERAQIPSSGRLVIVANHPLGSLDGMALLRLVSQVRRDVKIVANNHLSVVSALDDLIFPVDNMGGATTRQQIKAIHQYLNDEGAVIIFPAGEVSRLTVKGVRDGLWHKGFLKIARATKSPILPIHVRARNSMVFYLLSMAFRKLSTVLLVREMFGQAKKTVPLRIGGLVEPEGLSGVAANDNALAKLFRSHVEQIGKGKKGHFKTYRAVAQAERAKAVFAELTNHEILGETPDGKVIYLAKDIWDTVLLREIGRLREMSFRAVGEGTGRSRDFDDYDHNYYHL